MGIFQTSRKQNTCLFTKSIKTFPKLVLTSIHFLSNHYPLPIVLMKRVRSHRWLTNKIRTIHISGLLSNWTFFLFEGLFLHFLNAPVALCIVVFPRTCRQTWQCSRDTAVKRHCLYLRVWNMWFSDQKIYYINYSWTPGKLQMTCSWKRKKAFGVGLWGKYCMIKRKNTDVQGVSFFKSVSKVWIKVWDGSSLLFRLLVRFWDLHCKIDFNTFLGFKIEKFCKKAKSSESNFWAKSHSRGVGYV